MILRRRSSDNIETEKMILTGMIVNTDYLSRVRKKVNLEYFEQSSIREIASWVLAYYDKYRKAPGSVLQSIYTVKAPELKEADAELISEFLGTLSSQYEANEEKNFNTQYLMDQTDPYFDGRNLLLRADKIKGYVSTGKIDLAKKEIEGYKQTYNDIDDVVNLGDPSFIEEVYDTEFNPDKELSKMALFKMPGALGDLIGYLERDWLVSILAPRKRGKSFFLQQLAIEAARHKLQVLYISLEMSKRGQAKRFYQSITALSDNVIQRYPVRDCYKNQDGSCKRPERVNQHRLLISKEEKVWDKKQKKEVIKVVSGLPDFSTENPYRVCTACKHLPDFNGTFWWEEIKRLPLTKSNFVNILTPKVTSFKVVENIWLKCYPADSVSMREIIDYIDTFEYVHDVVPDVVAIDYADIVGASNSRGDKFEKIDETWKLMKSLSLKKHILVLTATQGNKKSGDKDTKNVDPNDVSWNIQKNDHVDQQYTLNQTLKEKRSGILRVAKSLDRWGEADAYKTVTLLQDLSRSQVILDCFDSTEYDIEEEDD
jgi:hypothetical protein